MNPTITLEELTSEQAMALVGSEDKNLRVLSECLGKEIVFRDHVFSILDGDEHDQTILEEVITAFYEVVKKGHHVSEQDVMYAFRMVEKNAKVDLQEISGKAIGRTVTGKPIVPKTIGQLSFAKAMNTHPIVFAIGPAGTGKTYLAVVQAVAALKQGDVKRIVLTRPAVEAGENLGFLPGDLKEKVDPYLTPLYDALHDMLGVEQTEKLMERGVVEIAPLAYMRGRTLDDSYVILDEAQNTTISQMKMFLTRLGFHSHMVITGDVTQIDLKPGVECGLIHAANILKDVEEIGIVYLSGDDVVRHPLVQKIIEKYEQ